MRCLTIIGHSGNVITTARVADLVGNGPDLTLQIRIRPYNLLIQITLKNGIFETFCSTFNIIIVQNNVGTRI